ncbi:4Fe-4S dicluster domain-containing protein [Neptuniibacter halophilus]|uniref:4Fe-4S dicluster domain-containing protein n=1 Tax=Neptuniibacter halophilus TaxID=651666 RepID=UPI002572B4C3|nr:4Fe-4S dicluster domain-containing protein [Neptuniibacter halophilus]
MSHTAPAFLAREDLNRLLQLLQGQGYRLCGPQVRDGTIVYDHLADTAALPRGWRDTQQPGHYRLQQHDSPRYFDWANGPQAIKPLTFPAREVLWEARRRESGELEFIVPDQALEKVAVIGVKACDLAALALQDQHFLQAEYQDPGYLARRKGLFLVGVNCSRAAATCFCVSTGDGPAIEQGYDLLLDELEEGFLIRSGSDSGAVLLAELPLEAALPGQIDAAEQQVQQVARSQQRRLMPVSPGSLMQQRQHPQWDDVADRCLACGNCTQVCPTCFCHHQQDLLQLSGEASEHQREWDSCFSESHGQLAGFQVRSTVKQRYQQWMTHKLDSWQEQYGRSGCTGCGRCMSWCPAAIDFVEEANKITGDG